MKAQHATPSVIIVFPYYNEADRLTVETLVAFQLPQRRVELVFVNDGSRDGTLRVLEAMRTHCCLTAADPPVHLPALQAD